MRGLDTEEKKNCCRISLEAGNHTRHCFMNGEYCSHQTNVLNERERLHKEGTINVFVIMNFSDMSDVVYKWRLNDFIKSLKNYLYIDLETQDLVCHANKHARDEAIKNKSKEQARRIEHIQIVRADSESATNYVICSRICQQLLIADLVVVDVSWQNPNVFYEFGMAVALGKMILPICYSESFYKRVVPDGLKKKLEKNIVLPQPKEAGHHMGCFPWRKALFEYYGLRYKGEEVKTKYIGFKEATNIEYGFSDIQYNRFPYDSAVTSDKSKWKDKVHSERVGEKIYKKLRRQYNSKGAESNTLVIYTMEGIMNEEQAGRCIINYYHDVVSRMKSETCFCGDRVGVLVQGNQIPEKDKDVSGNYNLLYSIAEITRTGVNQATYKVSKDKIAVSDKFKQNKLKSTIQGIEKDKGTIDFTEVHEKEIGDFVRKHVGNRGLLVYPDNPVYVERMKNGMYRDFLEDEDRRKEKGKKAFCFYHVMLKTLRYTNQIVVDITNNSIQSLFWLGAAHGAEVHAVTVLHEASEYEQSLEKGVQKKRNVFDVAGLWTAIHYTHDTEDFYRQLYLVQKGIEENSKLVLRNMESLETYLEGKGGEREELINKWEMAKADRERLMLESYYRNWFWKPMLKYNRLRIYLPQRDEKENNEPFLRVAKWDMDAVSSLTHYLSKRSVIGEYKVITLQSTDKDEKAKNINFITLGCPVNPLEVNLPQYIRQKYLEKGKNVGIYYCATMKKKEEESPIAKCNVSDLQKGFWQIGGKKKIMTQHSMGRCTYKCQKEFFDMRECSLINETEHDELAQLILWREEPENSEGEENKEYLFRVGITGSSGPATYALSSLFVDEENKLRDFLGRNVGKEEKQAEKQALLYDLQKELRDKVVDQYMIKLDNAISKIYSVNGEEHESRQRDCYQELVKYALVKYLSTVLYRYFFPFLSKKDIKRICNGIYMFVHSMKASRVSPFVVGYSAENNSNFRSAIEDEIVEAIIETIPSTLEEVLKEFAGVEAFYRVKVEHSDQNLKTQEYSANSGIRDMRKVKAIEAYKDSESKGHKINYLGF